MSRYAVLCVAVNDCLLGTLAVAGEQERIRRADDQGVGCIPGGSLDSSGIEAIAVVVDDIPDGYLQSAALTAPGD